MDINAKILALYPELSGVDVRTTYTLQNDGAGDYISRWDHPTLPQPTPEQLA